MNQKQIKEAKRIVKALNPKNLFMNKKGEFFTQKDLGLNSVKDSKDLEELKVSDFVSVSVESKEDTEKPKKED